MSMFNFSQAKEITGRDVPCQVSFDPVRDIGECFGTDGVLGETGFPSVGMRLFERTGFFDDPGENSLDRISGQGPTRH